MRRIVSLTTPIMLVIALSGCNTMLSPIEYEPIPGSITYKGQPRTKLTKVPIGSTFIHQIDLSTGDYYIETYQVQPDRNLKIIRRSLKRERHFFPD